MTQQEFFNRYSFNIRTDRLGGGGFGTVYKAYDSVLHREVALKVSEVKYGLNGKVFSLRDEFDAIKDLPLHPNIANYESLYSFDMPNGRFDYAVMQYYRGGSLSELMQKGLGYSQKEELARQLLEGIAFLHQHKVVHRDLKPANILVEERNGYYIPLITDFGLSKAASIDNRSVFSNSFGGGTQRYSSPEQLQGKPLRFNTDLWSYGVVLYELFTGEPLFEAGSSAKDTAQADLEVYNKIIAGDVGGRLGKVPELWQRVLRRCLVVNPNQRVKEAGELLAIIGNGAGRNNKEEKIEEEGVIVTHQDFLKRYNFNTQTDTIEKDAFYGIYKAFDNQLRCEKSVIECEEIIDSDVRNIVSLKNMFNLFKTLPKHHNVVDLEKLYSFKSEQRVIDYVVMPYFPDGTLSDVIRKGLSVAQKEKIALQLLDGLEHLHIHGVAHQDIKPNNIFIAQQQGRIIPLIMASVLSKYVEKENKVFLNEYACGTLIYSSPEQLQGKPLRFNTDLWSYGVVVYELFTGERLFDADSDEKVYSMVFSGNLGSRLSKVPEKWRKVLERCLVVDSEKRVQSAEEIRTLLSSENSVQEDHTVEEDGTFVESIISQTSGGSTEGNSSSGGDKKSVMELYPELNLVPTSLVRRSVLDGMWMLYFFVLLVSIALLVFGILLSIKGTIPEDGLPFIVVGIVLGVLWGILFYKKKLRHPYGGYEKLVKEADFVSGNRGLCIFVKNKHFGLIKLWDYTVYVPPIYDYMEWKTRDKYLRVKKDGREFLIDIYNNEI